VSLFNPWSGDVARSTTRKLFARSSLSLRLVAAATMVVAMWFTAAPVSAYVRYRSKTGCAYSWHTRHLTFKGFPKGMLDLHESQIANAMIQSANSWSQVNPELASCTDLRISVTMRALSDTPPAAAYDHQNNVTFRDKDWGPEPSDTRNCKDPFALAITAVFAHTSGEIVDTDIEVNTKNFPWGDLITDPAVGGRQDLQNALTHEMGHVVGFDHTCYLDPGKSGARDHNGDLIPYCMDQDLPPSARMATMFASANPGDVSKRTLEADDLAAVCHSYPVGQPDPELCFRSDDAAGGCALAPDQPGTVVAWQVWSAAALGLLAILLAASPLRRARERVRSRYRRP
jgi:hypothetical protein